MIWTRQPPQTRMYENGMPSFDFQKHAKEVNAAHDELHAAFALVANRNDEDDPRTKRWRTAINAFRAALARAYPEALRQVADGQSPASELSTNMMLDFIEADPVFYRSGYLKEKVLRQLKKRKFSEKEAERCVEASLLLCSALAADGSSHTIVARHPRSLATPSDAISKRWNAPTTRVSDYELTGSWRGSKADGWTSKERRAPCTGAAPVRPL